VSVLIAFLGALIAGFGGLIAYFQWRTAHQRVVLDLFDRRVKVFGEIEDAARDALNAADAKSADAAFWRFVGAERNARFLFGQRLVVKLASRRADVAAIMSFRDVRPDHPEYAEMRNRESQAQKNLVAFLEKSADEFAPYMRLDQQMPSIWWSGR
jgi:hypothetical protein